MDYQPKNLNRWTLPDSYAGAQWPEWFVFLGQHRDSEALTRSNFICGLKRLGGESDTVRVIRESHWAVSWVEWIGIHQSDSDALQQADEMAAAIESYPVLDEGHFSDLEWNETQDYWASLSIRERMEYCKWGGVSIFAARHDWIPQDDSGAIFDRLRG